MTTLLFIRHGEQLGEGDTPLSARGIIQAKKVAKELEQFHITKIYESNLLRAQQTCLEYQKSHRDILTITDARLAEIYRKIIGGPDKDGTSENRQELDTIRADEIYNQLIQEKGTIAIFCHGNIIRYFLAKYQNTEPKTMWAQPIEYASITKIEF